jgi:peptidoglycan hydrolase-like protein with peptidoglycan-binding domain
VATPKDAMPASASPGHLRAERSPRRRLRQRVDAAMPTKKSRLLSIVMAGGLVLAGVTAAATTNTGHAPARAALAANMASSPPVNLDNCPTLAEGYAGGCINQLQTELNTDNGTSMPVDGIFGPDTTKAVELFQQNHNVVPADGIVGPQTKAALDNPGLNPVAVPTPVASDGSGAANTTQTNPSPPSSSEPANPNPGSAPAAGAPAASGAPGIHCTEFGQNVSFRGVGVYNGTFCMYGIYSGTELTGLHYDWANVLGSVCLWWVDFNVYSAPDPNSGSRLVYHNQGGYNPTCDGSGHGNRYSGGVPTPLPITAPIGGQVCSTFWRQGSAGPIRVAGACEAITAKNG